MNIKKQYHKLFKTLSRLFGVRRAIKLIKSVQDSPESFLQDSTRISKSFYWSTTEQGTLWWCSVDENAQKRIKGY